MSDIAIRAEGLGKVYQLRHAKIGEAEKARLAENGGGFGSRIGRMFGREQREAFWALKDATFEIKKGEVTGIIGRNGSGKSTLLKIMSRIVEPSAGHADIYGRVSSLLEVGVGFHPELTGRENIFLNGAVLGMRTAEIKERFDEIVDFSEIEKFLDTPVKRYSSGMYVRLGFAVAAHLNPEILLVDEVLAVGDIEFQKKCLGRVKNMAGEGRTVLFVSHNMSAIQNLCHKCILLDRGDIAMEGPAPEAVKRYISALGAVDRGEVKWDDPETAPGDSSIRLHSVCVMDGHGSVNSNLEIDDEIVIKIRFRNFKDGARYVKSVNIKDGFGGWVLTALNAPSANKEPDPWYDRPHPIGLFETSFHIPANLLNNQTFSVDLVISSKLKFKEPEIRENDVISFTVHDMGSMSKEYQGPWHGPIRPRLYWSTEFKGED